jgi:ribosomal protein S6--L-glutamate ligase
LTTVSGRRIELWVEARRGGPAINPVMGALLEDLAAAGALTTVRVLEHEVVDPSSGPNAGPPDLVLLKTATTLALSVAVADEVRGVRFLNGARATLRAHDKAATVGRLAAAGLPVPATFLLEPGAGGTPPPGRPAWSTVDGRTARGAWVVKPTRGVHGRGVTVHRRFPELYAAPTSQVGDGAYIVDDGTRLIQRRVGDGRVDVKVYVAGDWTFAGLKRFGPASYAADRIEPCALDRATLGVVREAGKALGLRCFGVDLRFERERPVIVDVNPFPGYRGFPAAVPALRSEIERSLGPAVR